VVLAALETLAARPDVDSGRLGLLGGSLGGFYALRAAAQSRLPKVCVEFAAPFDIGTWLPHSVRGLQMNFAWVLGARTLDECFALARPLHLRGILEEIECPVFVGHGTNDHFVFFTTVYEIARRLRVPPTVHPFIGADHEVALPATPAFSAPVVAWLKEHL
jgi:dipeptidyl aminopeptidase/acylaminoacyl peptidase